jgi:hypothetical protein
VRPFAVLLPLVLSGLPALAPMSPAPPTGEDLVRQMHDRYAGKWYRTLSFVQTSHFADGRTETWYEAAEIPGKLRIDIAPLDSMNAIVFRSDSVYVFRGGKLRVGRPEVHPLMVLGFDVYATPVEETIRKLQDRKIDLGMVREATWQGRPTWVVGAAEGDTTSAQFWVDQERLLFVRLIETGDGPSGPAREETQFNKYRPLGGGWIAPECVFYINGKLFLTETYEDARADPSLAPSTFAVDSFRTPAWIPR